MLGIKTKILNYLEFNHYQKNKKFSNDARIVKLMKFFQADEYGHECNIKQADLGFGWIHYGLIRQLKPKKVLCIGSRYGFIPALLAQACSDNGFGMVDFVDAGYGDESKLAWTGKGYWKTKAGQNCFTQFGLENNIKIFITTTKKFAQKYKNSTYNYIYIDGDHSYKGVKLDFELFWPKLNIGGYMIFHDICVKEKLREGKYGVWKLWQEQKNKQKIEINYLPSGLGVLQKK